MPVDTPKNVTRQLRRDRLLRSIQWTSIALAAIGAAILIIVSVVARAIA